MKYMILLTLSFHPPALPIASPTYPFSTGLPTCAWVWGHPVQHGEPTSGAPSKGNDFPSPSSSSARGGASGLGFWLAFPCVSNHSCYELLIASPGRQHPTLSHPAAGKFFPAPFLRRTPSLGGGGGVDVGYRCPFQDGALSLFLSALWLALHLLFDCCLLLKLNGGHRCRYLEGPLTAC